MVVVEDHPLFRSGLTALLGDLERFEVVGQAGSGEQAEEVVTAAHPDVVLMDLHLPGIGGVETTARIIARQPGTAVLVLTMLEEGATVLAAMQAGARGYLLKEATPDEIVRAVEAVADGQVVFGGSAAAKVLATLADRPKLLPRLLPELTDREVEVLGLMGRGLTNAAIAECLYLSDKDCAQPRVEHLHQAWGERPCCRRSAGPRHRPRRHLCRDLSPPLVVGSGGPNADRWRFHFVLTRRTQPVIARRSASRSR
ncbi:MAG TPA: response regulator transcription factor [Acidimicrobiales bacterium]|nr:response regulator transcription factor [Acidimicrobiales bacterium]